MSEAAGALPPPRASFWRRRVLTPILDQLRQGVTAEKIALTLALGVTVSLFPLLGATTLLATLLAYFLRLNQPIMQTVNYASYPAQIALLIPFYRAGAWLFRHPHEPLSLTLFLERMRVSFPQFVRDFGVLTLEAIAVWSLLAPVVTALLYYSLRPPLRALARGTSRAGRS